MNISNKYSAKVVTEEELQGMDNETMYKVRRGMFRDTHSKIIGPAVNDLLVSFLESYEEVSSNQRFRIKPREWLKEVNLRRVWQRYKGRRKRIEPISKASEVSSQLVSTNATDKHIVTSAIAHNSTRSVENNEEMAAEEDMMDNIEEEEEGVC